MPPDQGRTVIKVTYVSAEDAPVLSLKSESKGILASLSRKSTGAPSPTEQKIR